MQQPCRKFALFFTTLGRSLESWDKLGMFEREVALYRFTAGSFDTVYFFTYGGAKDRSYAPRLPANVIIVPKPAVLPVMLYSFLLPLIHWKKLRTVDLLKTNQMDGSWAAVIAKKLFGGKLIVRCGYEWLQFIERAGRSWMKRTFAYWAERFAYGNADRIVVTSIGAQQFITRRFTVAPAFITIIPNYVTTELFKPRAIHPEEGRVIAIGRLEPQKNLLQLIEALQGLPLRLVLIGKGSQREILEREARARAVSVEFMGALPQAMVAQELCKSEVYILPSLYEGHPKTLLEAMACGVPCIGSDIEGIRDTIVDGKDGIICGTDAASIRSAIVTLHGDNELRKRIGAAAHRTVMKTYSLENIVEQELSVYRSLGRK